MSNFVLNEGEKLLLGVKNDHEWRKQKRREMDAVIKAIDVYLDGSAYTPMSALSLPEYKMSLMHLAQHLRGKLTVKNWGR